MSLHLRERECLLQQVSWDCAWLDVALLRETASGQYHRNVYNLFLRYVEYFFGVCFFWIDESDIIIQQRKPTMTIISYPIITRSCPISISHLYLCHDINIEHFAHLCRILNLKNPLVEGVSLRWHVTSILGRWRQSPLSWVPWSCVLNTCFRISVLCSYPSPFSSWRTSTLVFKLLSDKLSFFHATIVIQENLSRIVS